MQGQAVDRKVGQVQEQLNEMNDALSRLEQVISAFEADLEPVIKPPRPETKETGPPVEEFVPLANLIREQIRRVEQANAQVRSLRERLEV